MRFLRTCLVILACPLLLTACDDASSSSATGGAASKPSAVSDIEAAAKDAGAAVSDAAKDAMSKAADQYASTLDKYETQLEPLKAAAATFKDKELTGIVGLIDENLADAKSKVSELGSADAKIAEGLKGEIKSLMDEIPDLLEDAGKRMNQLKSSLPGGVKIPGGDK